MDAWVLFRQSNIHNLKYSTVCVTWQMHSWLGTHVFCDRSPEKISSIDMCGHLRRSWCAASRQHYLELQVSLSASNKDRSSSSVTNFAALDTLSSSCHCLKRPRCLRPACRAARRSLGRQILVLLGFRSSFQDGS
ncbi:hypothetical protein DAI22_06g083500 [Oryza sativa Japonica Group]|nr:hypothetical protein DAI22_06g083500 [Oryza sativa Japonica Group]